MIVVYRLLLRNCFNNTSRAITCACSRLLLPDAILLNVSQLTRGVGMFSHAALRRLCLMSLFMCLL